MLLRVVVFMEPQGLGYKFCPRFVSGIFLKFLVIVYKKTPSQNKQPGLKLNNQTP